jgi:hypothetical protein
MEALQTVQVLFKSTLALAILQLQYLQVIHTLAPFFKTAL